MPDRAVIGGGPRPARVIPIEGGTRANSGHSGTSSYSGPAGTTQAAEVGPDDLADVRRLCHTVSVDIDQLFVCTLDDLEQRTTATDEYEVLMSAALLRKLLLDQTRLTDQVNRRYRLNLRFRIGAVSPCEQLLYEDNPVFWAIEDALDPDCALAYVPYDATRDQFLARRVMRFSGSWLTVRDVVNQLANIEGAVHRGEAKDAWERALLEVARFYKHSGLPGAVNQLKLIGRITVRGLGPLRDAVTASAGQQG